MVLAVVSQPESLPPMKGGGKLKFKYCRRKVFWDCVAKHVLAGYDPATTIDKIHAAYGHSLSVTKILDAMKVDKKNGGHINLRI